MLLYVWLLLCIAFNCNDGTSIPYFRFKVNCIYVRCEYHPQLVAVYHRCGASYIINGLTVYIPSGNDGLRPYCIKPRERYTLMRDEIQPEGLMIYTTLCAVMIYQACGLDKKSTSKACRFLACPTGFEPATSRVGVSRAIQLGHGQIRYASAFLPPKTRCSHSKLLYHGFGGVSMLNLEKCEAS